MDEGFWEGSTSGIREAKFKSKVEKYYVWHLYAALWGLIPAHVLHFFCVGSLLYACVCVFMSVSACERGKRWQGARWSLLSLTQHLSHFIIKSPVTNSSGNRQRWGRQEKSCDESGGGHLDAENTPSLMQLVCLTSKVTLTWRSHPCVIFRYGGGSSPQTPTSQETLLHLSERKQKTLRDNTINTDCDLWSNVFWESKSTMIMKNNSEKSKCVHYRVMMQL